MNKIIFSLLAALLCLGLMACGETPPPEKAADGSDWSEDWVAIGDIMGIDTPAEFTLRDNKDALSGSGMYYAAWSIGEESSYLDTDSTDGGEETEVTIYDAQLFLLLGGSSTLEKAGETEAEWLALADEHYQIDSKDTRTYNGQEFTVITYHFPSGPYAKGASAFGTYGNYAVSAEFSCQEAFEGDPAEYLALFLEHCHYGA